MMRKWVGITNPTSKTDDFVGVAENRQVYNTPKPEKISVRVNETRAPLGHSFSTHTRVPAILSFLCFNL